MNRQEILDMVESVHREWGVDREQVFHALEEAFASALQKHLRMKESVSVHADRTSGELRATSEGRPLDLAGLGRLAYRAARARFMQQLKEARRRTAAEEFSARRGTIVAGTISRVEDDVVECRIGPRIEGILPLREQIPGEAYLPGELLHAYVLEVDLSGPLARIVLSRSCDLFVAKLFEREVPEVAAGTCVLRGIAREAGYRTKVFVESTREPVDAVGACVGVGRCRVKNIVAELNGENVDIIPWSADHAERIRLAMRPADIADLRLDERRRHATLYVPHGSLSQAIGKAGRNVRLASRLTGWEIDVFESPQDGEPAGSPAGRGSEPREGDRS